LLVFVSLAVVEIQSAHRAIVGKLSTFAEMVGHNLVGALAFDDSAHAEEILLALRAEPQIEYADIHLVDGTIFAAYDRGESGRQDRANSAVAAADHGVSTDLSQINSFDLLLFVDRLDIIKPIWFDNEILGEIHLRSNLDDMQKKIILFCIVGGFAFIILFVISIFLALALHRNIYEQIVDLVSTMNSVARDNNYTVRAEKSRDDELGLLVDGFNSMLVQLDGWGRGIEDARARAETANHTKSEFLATMSHELRTPLNSIIGFSEIIQNETFGPVGSAQYRGYASDIYNSGQHLLGLINDILDLSKVESGTEELHEEDISIRDLTHSALRLVRQRAEKSGIELELDLGDDLPLLRADERKLKQILVNLLTNAVKFTDAGGKVTLVIWCRMDSGFVFQVIDTGVGLAPEDIPKALSQFGQVDRNRNRTQEGTGLGLPLSKSLAELHGGSLDLQSRPGFGTTVTLRLPAVRIVTSLDNSDWLDVEGSEAI
jgi:signal transduction histidine kinase